MMSHIMRLDIIYESGNEVWQCDDCGRRIMISMEEPFQVTVIEEGNNNIIHSGSKGGLIIGNVSMGEES